MPTLRIKANFGIALSEWQHNRVSQEVVLVRRRSTAIDLAIGMLQSEEVLYELDALDQKPDPNVALLLEYVEALEKDLRDQDRYLDVVKNFIDERSELQRRILDVGDSPKAIEYRIGSETRGDLARRLKTA